MNGVGKGKIDPRAYISSADELRCSPPPVVAYAIMKQRDGQKLGAAAFYTCMPGFKMMGKPYQFCAKTADGRDLAWGPSSPPWCSKQTPCIYTRCRYDNDAKPHGMRITGAEQEGANTQHQCELVLHEGLHAKRGCRCTCWPTTHQSQSN